MDGSHSVNCVGPNNSQVCHVDSLLTTFLYQGHASHAIHVARPTFLHFLNSNMASQFEHNTSFVTDNVRSKRKGNVFRTNVILSTGRGSLFYDAPGQEGRRAPLLPGTRIKWEEPDKKHWSQKRVRHPLQSSHLWDPPPLARGRCGPSPLPTPPQTGGIGKGGRGLYCHVMLMGGCLVF